MRRAEAVGRVLAALSDELVVACNGMIGREVWTARDRPENFYMIGSMGLALSIGLGLALCRPQRQVLVLDGDGNVLMGGAAMASAAAAGAANLLHVVLDNRSHASTGGQRTISGAVALEEMARGCGYRFAQRVAPQALEAALPEFLRRTGPAMLLVEVEGGNEPGIGRVELSPPRIARRFAEAARK
jgi:thiamine pyrophosphate-dependent acetolactate synthase large subunit-like protein